MALDGEGLLRLTVEGPEPVVVDLDPGGFDTPVGRAGIARWNVWPMPQTHASRATGQRRYEAVVDGWVFHVTVEAAERARLRERAARAAGEVGHHVSVAVRARIPGRVIRLWVKSGEAVEAGQPLLAVEAMKMENEVRAPRAGVVGALPVGVGQTVELGDELVTLE